MESVQKRVAKLTPHVGCELPIEAYLGTVWLLSAAGTIIEFYTWHDPAYCHGPMYETEDIVMTQATVHNLARADRAYLNSAHWDDFTMYGREMFHMFLQRLQRRGFTLHKQKLN